jgi:hypothetical protein
MPTGDTSQKTKIRHVANKNISAFKILNPLTGLQGAKNPDQSTYIRNSEGRITYVTRTALGQIVDDSINDLFTQNNGISTVSTVSTLPKFVWILNTNLNFESIQYIYSYAYGAGMWVMVGSDLSGNAVILTTPNPGGVWTSRNVPGLGVGNQLRDIFFAEGIFVIVGDSVILTSRNPMSSWTPVSFTPPSLQSVYYADSIWVTLYGSAILTSTDPTGSWPGSSIVSQTGSFQGIAYGNGTWVLIENSSSGNGTLRITNDPSVGPATSVKSFATEYLTSIAYGNGVWVLLSSLAVYTSTDPSNVWTRNITVTDIPNSIANRNELWVSVGQGNAIYTTADPKGAWTRDTSASLNYSGINNLLLIKYGNNTFVTTGLTNNKHQLFTYNT